MIRKIIKIDEAAVLASKQKKEPASLLCGCPKLDEIDYSEKLTAILANNNVKSVTVVRMEVPCCGGIVRRTRHIFWNLMEVQLCLR